VSTSHVDHPYAATRREHTLDIDYDAFTRHLESLLGTMDVALLEQMAGRSAESVRETLASLEGTSSFLVFQRLDHGTLLTVLGGRPTRATTYVFGNVLIAVEMTKYAPRVGLYVPLRMFVYELARGRLAVTYDVPSHALAQYGSAEVDSVARGLDAKVEQLVAEAARLAPRAPLSGITT
jgi:uncharacterized protein (DUF302 family)